MAPWGLVPGMMSKRSSKRTAEVRFWATEKLGADRLPPCSRAAKLGPDAAALRAAILSPREREADERSRHTIEGKHLALQQQLPSGEG